MLIFDTIWESLTVTDQLAKLSCKSFFVRLDLSKNLHKMTEKTYECVKCKKLCVGYPATNRNKCLACRNVELRTYYEGKRMQSLSKKELILENRKLEKKLLLLNKDDDYDSVSDSLSEVSDREKDQDYVPETPQRSSKRSLIKRKIVQQEAENNPKKQKTDFSIATKTQVLRYILMRKKM